MMRGRRILLGLGGALLLALAGGAVWLLRGSAPDVPELPRIDRIVIHKGAREMELWSGGKLVHTMQGVALGNAPVGQKHFEGDGKTPEGRYAIDFRNGESSYHLSLRLSYPDAAATAFAKAQGRSPGGEIYIHGQPNWLSLGRLKGDWTQGCVAVSNQEIEALWRAVPLGAVVDVTA
ncbi:L,D-transpeptidase family protein [Novosphingobium sp. B 225]|uniref:L,D-transpeptidase family protein n=1 Tax=Novosphingobium sp. B 225 TaxID=1961849 RepID=UPI000B4B01B5|nr:L,D-transpeptidase family protein [Novosphingobium sp. B 225]